MLKNTFTNVKKVCTITFLPRIWRGHIIKCGPGKFQKLLDVSKSPGFRRLKSSSKKNSEKAQRIINYVFGETNEYPFDDIRGFVGPWNTELSRTVTAQVSVKPKPVVHQKSLSDNEKEIFGAVKLSDVAKTAKPQENDVELLQTTTEKIEEKLLRMMHTEEDDRKNFFSNTRSLYATTSTSKEADEKLPQKIEEINEPTVVEAGTPTQDTSESLSKLLSGKVMEQPSPGRHLKSGMAEIAPINVTLNLSRTVQINTAKAKRQAGSREVDVVKDQKPESEEDKLHEDVKEIGGMQEALKTTFNQPIVEMNAFEALNTLQYQKEQELPAPESNKEYRSSYCVNTEGEKVVLTDSQHEEYDSPLWRKHRSQIEPFDEPYDPTPEEGPITMELEKSRKPTFLDDYLDDPFTPYAPCLESCDTIEKTPSPEPMRAEPLVLNKANTETSEEILNWEAKRVKKEDDAYFKAPRPPAEFSCSSPYVHANYVPSVPNSLQKRHKNPVLVPLSPWINEESSNEYESPVVWTPARYSQIMLNYYYAQKQFSKDMAWYRANIQRYHSKPPPKEVTRLMKKVDKTERDKSKMAGMPVLPINSFRTVSTPSMPEYKEVLLEDDPIPTNSGEPLNVNVERSKDIKSVHALKKGEAKGEPNREQNDMRDMNDEKDSTDTDIPSRLQQTLHTAGTQAVTKPNELSSEPKSIPEEFHSITEPIKIEVKAAEPDIKEIETEKTEEDATKHSKPNTVEGTIAESPAKSSVDVEQQPETPLTFKSANNVPLSVMLEQVRLKNKLDAYREFLNSMQTERNADMSSCTPKTPKCPTKKPACTPKPCPPPKKSACPPPQKADPCPKPKPCPDPCKPQCPPKKKGPCSKCVSVNKSWDPQRPVYTILSWNVEQIMLATVDSCGVSTDLPFQPDDETEMNEKRGMLHIPRPLLRFARDFEPWTPIPCWPVPRNEPKKKLFCPKDGCKTPPPIRDGDFCKPKQYPCKGFPKRVTFTNYWMGG